MLGENRLVIRFFPSLERLLRVPGALIFQCLKVIDARLKQLEFVLARPTTGS
jgi:hypothetical protein